MKIQRCENIYENNPAKKKVVLAYSGGLDSSVILKWLIEKDYELIAFMADVGQEEDFKEAEKKALQLGAKKVVIIDLKKSFVDKFIFPSIKANAVYEGNYLLGTALARPLIAKTQIDIAKKENANCLAHGCTGKGNDQIRFELAFMQFMPDAKIISPWKDPEWLAIFKGRTDMINFANTNNIPVKATIKKPYSTDENLMHTSFEAGILEDTMNPPSNEIFKKVTPPVLAKDEPDYICIEFEKGIPKKITDKTNSATITESVELLDYLNKIGGKNGIGIIDIVENRCIGIKSRGVYETPGVTILIKAHKLLESITLDKGVMHLKEIFSPIIAKNIYDGLWFTKEMDVLMAAVEESQKFVSGKVYLELYKGNMKVMGIESENSLYNQNISSMDEEGGFNQEDSKGFIKIFGLGVKMQGVKNEIMAKKLQVE